MKLLSKHLSYKHYSSRGWDHFEKTHPVSLSVINCLSVGTTAWKHSAFYFVRVLTAVFFSQEYRGGFFENISSKI